MGTTPNRISPTACSPASLLRLKDVVATPQCHQPAEWLAVEAQHEQGIDCGGGMAGIQQENHVVYRDIVEGCTGLTRLQLLDGLNQQVSLWISCGYPREREG